jgi:hypothetical protein
MDRSQCVMCGKTRFRKYLLYVLDLNCRNVWVCSHPVACNQNYIKINDVNYLHSPCHLRFLKMQYDVLQSQINNYQFSKILFPLYQKVLQHKNVAPELTFLLQL